MPKQKKEEFVKAEIPKKEHLPNSYPVASARPQDKAKQFNFSLYGESEAARLYAYAQFATKNPRGRTPPGMAGGRKPPGGEEDIDEAGNDIPAKGDLGADREKVLARYQKKVYESFGGKDRDLGTGGDFSEVRYTLSEDRFIEKAVIGPATGRIVERKEADERRLMDKKNANETPEQQKLRKDIEKKKAKKAKKAEKNNDWRTNPLRGTRTDTDFLREIGDNAPAYTKTVRANEKAAVPTSFVPFPSHIGPQRNEMDYDLVEQIVTESVFKNKTFVEEQLRGRLIEPPNWTEPTRDLSKNRYLSSVTDDKLEPFREERRRELLQQSITNFTAHAVELVRLREKLRKEGYTSIPVEHANMVEEKLAGMKMKKNLWRDFKRLIIRKRMEFKSSFKNKITDLRALNNGASGRAQFDEDEKRFILAESESMYDACDQGNVKLAQVALSFGARVDFRRAGKTALQMVFARLCQIDAGLEVEPTWQEGYKYSDRADYDGIITSLLQYGADINAIEDKENTDGFGLVHHAARLGRYDRVKFFIDQGGMVDLRTRTNETALMKACEGGHLDVVIFLVHTNHDIHALTSDGLNLLHFAAMRGDYNIIRFLLEAGADAKKKDDRGKTPYEVCMERRFTRCAELMQKFCLPRPSNKPLVQFWSDLQRAERPDSPSWMTREELDAPPPVVSRTNTTYVKRNSLIVLEGKQAQENTMKIKRRQEKKEAADKLRLEKKKAERSNGFENLDAIGKLEGLMKKAAGKAGNKTDKEPPDKKEFEDLWREFSAPGNEENDDEAAGLSSSSVDTQHVETAPKKFSFFSPGLKSPGSLSSVFASLTMLSPSYFSPTKKLVQTFEECEGVYASESPASVGKQRYGFFSSPLFARSPGKSPGNVKLPPVSSPAFGDGATPKQSAHLGEQLLAAEDEFGEDMELVKIAHEDGIDNIKEKKKKKRKKKGGKEEGDAATE